MVFVLIMMVIVFQIKSNLKIKIYPTIIFKNTLWYWNTSCFPYSKIEYKAYTSRIFINLNELL